MTFTFEAPVAVRSANDMLGAHRMMLHREAKMEKRFVYYAALNAGIRKWQAKHRAPYIVVLTRIIPKGGQPYDDGDNDRTGFKHARDEVASLLGWDDSARSPIRWVYGPQEPSEGAGGLRVAIHGQARE